MRTLEEVLKRNDYKRLTKNLESRVEELAKLLREKLVQLELEEFGDYSIRTVKSRSGFSETFLAYYDWQDYYNLESINYSYYLANDYCCRIEGATTKMALYFLNNFKEILAELDEYETEMCKKIQNSLNKSEDINL